jgi:hypothetical protein
LLRIVLHYFEDFNLLAYNFITCCDHSHFADINWVDAQIQGKILLEFLYDNLVIFEIFFL